MYTEQSQNGSIKTALAVSTIFQQIQESLMRRSFHWLELQNQYLFVRQLGFSYFAHTFFANALHRTVVQFTESGIMQHIFDENYNFIILNQPEPNSPNVLNLHDLAFGFYIWLVTFGISILVFFIEISVLKFKKNKKLGRLFKRENSYQRQVKFCKIYPSMFDEEYDSTQSILMKSDTLMRFKVRTRYN